MVRVIMGLKGSGKTKQMIELVNAAARSGDGSILCIERGSNLTFDIHYKVRLIDVNDYDMSTFELLRGFISGLYANNYDLNQVFIDSLCKVVPSKVSPAVEDFLDWLNAFGEKHHIQFTVTITADVALATERIRNYF